jgi:hypothetical protein
VVVEEAAAVESGREHRKRADPGSRDGEPVASRNRPEEKSESREDDQQAQHRMEHEPDRWAVEDRPGHALGDAAEVLGRVGAGVVGRNLDEEIGRHAEHELDHQRDQRGQIGLAQPARHPGQ